MMVSVVGLNRQPASLGIEWCNPALYTAQWIFRSPPIGALAAGCSEIASNASSAIALLVGC